MKTALVCALILTLCAIGGRTSFAAPRRCIAVKPDAYARVTVPVASRYPAPVAEMTNHRGSVTEGLLLRVATAPDPVQMINPAAPATYGTGRNLVSYSVTQVHRDANPNVLRPHSDGLRLWSMREFW